MDGESGEGSGIGFRDCDDGVFVYDSTEVKRRTKARNIIPADGLVPVMARKKKSAQNEKCIRGQLMGFHSIYNSYLGAFVLLSP